MQEAHADNVTAERLMWLAACYFLSFLQHCAHIFVHILISAFTKAAHFCDRAQPSLLELPSDKASTFC